MQMDNNVINYDFLSETNLELLPKRLEFCQLSGASEKLYNFLCEDYSGSFYERIIIVGTGGSYPAAFYAKFILMEKLELNTHNIEAVFPQTAMRMLNKIYDKHNIPRIIAISYSGTSPDIVALYDLCKEIQAPFVLVTGAKKEDIKFLYKDNATIISYYNPEDTTDKEKSFISMFSTLAPMLVFSDYPIASKNIIQDSLKVAKEYVNNNKDLIKKIALKLKEAPIINVFYEWDTLPCALDIQSKFIESGIAHVILHEQKNFSHGCYVSLYTLPVGLNIYLDRRFMFRLYNEQLKDFISQISKEKDIPYIRLGTSTTQTDWWNMQELFKLPYLIVEIGKELSIDISKPLKPFPEAPRKLYHYEGEF